MSGELLGMKLSVLIWGALLANIVGDGLAYQPRLFLAASVRHFILRFTLWLDILL